MKNRVQLNGCFELLVCLALRLRSRRQNKTVEGQVRELVEQVQRLTTESQQMRTELQQRDLAIAEMRGQLQGQADRERGPRGRGHQGRRGGERRIFGLLFGL